MDDGGTKRSGRGRGRTKSTCGRGRGRGKKATRVISSDEDEEVASSELEKGIVALPEKRSTTSKEPATIAPSQRLMDAEPVESIPEPLPVTSVLSAPSSAPLIIDMEADISQLEAPTFTTISRGPPEPMVRLSWNHKVNLIGEKVLNPMIYCCDRCDNPILIYGRMIPCKHVFCLRCARSETFKVCPRCSEKVVRVEQTHLGTVFMCTHGGTRYGNAGCRRTYLSQRDLQAHINHRHVTNLVPPQPLPPAQATIQPLVIPPPHQTVPIQPMELSPSSKLLSEKVHSGGVASLPKSSCEQLKSPRSGMMRPSELGDSYYSYGNSSSYNTNHIAPNQQLHMPIGVSQLSPVQQHLSRTGYSPYEHQTSSPHQQHTQSSTTPSISSTLWSQSTSQYYR